jgi:hypothetical protein
MKKIIIAIVIVVLLGVGVYYFINSSKKVVFINDGNVVSTSTVATSTVLENKAEVVIGKSVEGRDIMAYNFGTGTDKILFVAGIHGGYDWNTALVGYELIDYLKANPNVIPANVKVTVIPVLNPDGLNKVVGTSTKFALSAVPATEALMALGRFNASQVDLNRNFDCDWQANGTWQSKTVSGGSSAFSEPESLAIKNFITAEQPKAVVAWYSAAGGVFSSSCHNGVLPETKDLTNVFAKASGYPAYEEFNFYEVTGDMVNWLAKEKIPAISVLLTNHKDVEWTKNKAGVEAVLKYYAD